MEGYRHSTLNPLATCFVPSNMRKAILQDNKICKGKDNNVKRKARNKHLNSIVKFKTKLGFKTNIKFDILVNSSTLSEFLDLTQRTVKLLNENLYFSEKCVNLEHSKCLVTNTSQWPVVDVTSFLKFFLMALFGLTPLNDHSNTYALEYNKNESDSKATSETEEKCSCPPMFGCIVPPDFFGNPFNLNSSCSKKNVHVCHYSRVNESSVPSSMGSDGWSKTNNEKMEGSHDFFTDAHQRNDRVSTCSKSTSTSVSTGFKMDFARTEPYYTDLNSIDSDNLKNEISKEPIDDDIHPLLDEGICMDADEGTFEIEKKADIKRSLEQMSQRFSFDPGVFTEKSICNPPCSVWCDSLPQSAKETYRKFIKSLPQYQQDLWSCTKLGQSERPSSRFHQSAYNRTQSTYFKKEGFQTGFEVKRSLLAKPSLQNYKLNQTPYSTKYKHALSMNLSHKILGKRDSSLCNKTMWGVFDGEDSLWQALPDCSPLGTPKY